MKTQELNGRVVALKIKEQTKKRVTAFYKKYNKYPVLATIIVGTDPSSVMYVKMKKKACEDVGIIPRVIELSEKIKENELIKIVNDLNNDKLVSGILIQHPLPKHITEENVFNTIDISKDVDGLNPVSYGMLTMNMRAFAAATPAAIMEILKYYKIKITGLHTAIVGRSPILGKPLASLMLNEDATVTICHSKTKNLKSILKTADIVIGALGKSNYIKKDYLKEGVILIDAGYNKNNTGDIDLKNCISISKAYTPVPGGVGPVTIAKLLEQTITAAEVSQKK